MFHTTQGIVLNTIKYNDKSYIVKIYTSSFGIQSYIVHGYGNKKASLKNVLFQPLYLLHLIVAKEEKRNFQKIKEAKIDFITNNILTDPIKRAIALFINEIILKTIKEEEQNENLYTFLEKTILALNNSSNSCVNFHLIFLIELTKHLGFYPQTNTAEILFLEYFDLQEGIYLNSPPNHQNYLEKELTKHLIHLSNSNYENSHLISITNDKRKVLIENLIRYYSIHLERLSAIKSHKILEDIFS